MNKENNKNITLAHGSGGIQMQELLQSVIFNKLHNKYLYEQTDGAVLNITSNNIVFTTDSFVVQPIFFPGGDIGHLCVCGTVNDLLMMGATPRALSLSLIIESGFEIDLLEKIIDSVKKTSKEAGAEIVTGDTKVVGPGQADKIYINTAGIGVKNNVSPTGWQTIQPGDAVIVSGTLGHHGLSILAARAELPFEQEILSDVAVLTQPVLEITKRFSTIRWMRDATRGGVAAVLNEIASQARVEIEIQEENLPITDEIRGAAELLGLDPLYLANEGRFVLICAEEQTAEIIELLKKYKVSSGAQYIGFVKEKAKIGSVILKTNYGSKRVIDMPSGEQMPRIC